MNLRSTFAPPATAEDAARLREAAAELAELIRNAQLLRSAITRAIESASPRNTP